MIIDLIIRSLNDRFRHFLSVRTIIAFTDLELKTLLNIKLMFLSTIILELYDAHTNF